MNKIISRIAILIIATTFTIAAQSPEYLGLLDKIDKAVAQSDWAAADSLTLRAIRADEGSPTNVLLMSNLGMIRFYSGRDSAALAILNQAHDMAPASVTVLANRARILTANGRQREAIADYNLIEQIDSTYADTYLYRGIIYLYAADFEHAEVDLKKREALSPSDEQTLVAMASLYSVTDRHDEALPYYSKLISHSPTAEYYAGRAMCHLKADRLMDAADDIGSGLMLDAEYGELYLCRAILNKLYYRTDDSLRDASIAISLGVNPLRVNALLDNH